MIRSHIQNYSKTRNAYIDYRKAGYSAKFRAAHEDDILLHQATKRAFNELGVKKLPTVKNLNAEYAECRRKRSEMKELLTVKANMDLILEAENHVAENETPRENRSQKNSVRRTRSRTDEVR